LEQEFGQPLPAYWAACLPENDALIDEDRFGVMLENLLRGPVAHSGRVLVLVVEGLSRVTTTHLEQWAYLMSSLAGNPTLPLKLLVWGGQELHELCRGAKFVGRFSPFQRLRVRRVGLLSADEVAQQVTKELGTATGAEALYALTRGHPDLVHECIEHAPSELRQNNQAGLRARILNTSSCLWRLQDFLQSNQDVSNVLQRLLQGEHTRRPGTSIAEDRLYWLGILTEKDAEHWQWTAPVLADWAQRWLGSRG
jgi:hypothetical protein